MAQKLPKYILVESKVNFAKHELIKVYGIKEINTNDTIFVEDISSNVETVKKFVDICNFHSVSTLNFQDVLEDYIS